MEIDEGKRNLFDLTMGKKWDEISRKYSIEKWVHEAIITKDKNTALNVAILSYNPSESTNNGKYIEKMIKSMSQKSLKKGNAKGDTPLHLAAAVGWTEMCSHMANTYCELIMARNEKNETPLFVAAQYGKTEAFSCLCDILKKVGHEKEGDSLCRRKDGNTALHFALSGESFDIANLIINSYPNLVDGFNIEGESPLHIMAKKTAIFKDVTDLKYFDSLICKYALVELSQGLEKITISKKDFGFPQNYRTCANIFNFFWFPLQSIIRASRGRVEKQHNANQKDEESQLGRVTEPQGSKTRSENGVHHSFPLNYTTLVLLLKFAINIILTIVGVGLGKIKKIEQKRKKRRQACDIIKKLLTDKNYKYVNDGHEPTSTKLSSLELELPNDPSNPEEKTQEQHSLAKGDTPFIIAAKNGIDDMVEIILNKLHIAIYDQDSEGRNVLMLAAKHRQMAVLDLLSTKQIPELLFQHMDNDGNSIIHLTAMLEDYDKPKHIHGAALQMQWEIKWFAYVKKYVPSTCFAHHINKNGQTPDEIFTKTHENLMRDGYTWMIKTSESCSVIAALVAGSAFATASSVPGGTNEDTGRPVLEGEVAFDVFSISSLIGLCLAVTALIFFLAIITSRCVEKDFKLDLPLKLLSGLTCLFVSIVAMLVTYCAGHTFVLKNQLQFVEIPIYTVACVPVSLYAFAQLPLYADLVRAVCINKPLR